MTVTNRIFLSCQVLPRPRLQQARPRPAPRRPGREPAHVRHAQRAAAHDEGCVQNRCDGPPPPHFFPPLPLPRRLTRVGRLQDVTVIRPLVFVREQARPGSRLIAPTPPPPGPRAQPPRRGPLMSARTPGRRCGTFRTRRRCPWLTRTARRASRRRASGSTSKSSSRAKRRSSPTSSRCRRPAAMKPHDAACSEGSDLCVLGMT